MVTITTNTNEQILPVILILQANLRSVVSIGWLQMNIITGIKSIVLVALMMSISGVVFSAGNDIFQSRIDKQTKAVEVARKAKEINFAESQSLNKEIKAIQALYDKYFRDKKISADEAKKLESKLNNSDVNLFRKKYD